MKNVAVIFGGASVEHDVSIVTGLKICKSLRRTFNLLPIYFSLDNKFYYLKGVNFNDYQDKEKLVNLGKHIQFINGSIYVWAGKKLKEYIKLDQVINCCHGGVGENGELSAYLKLNKIPCSSSLPSSAICVNKYALKQFAKGLGINVNECVLITNTNLEEKLEYIKMKFKNDLVVKPNTSGSSIGIIKTNYSNLKENSELLLHLDNQLLVEEYLEDIEELHCAIVVHKNTICLSQIEKIKLNNNIFSFEDKYINKVTKREVPAKIPDKIKVQIYDACKKLHDSLNFVGVVEMQFFYAKNGEELFLNEVNAVPKNLCFNLFEELGISSKMMAEYLTSSKDYIKKQTYFDSDILYKIDLV